MLPATPPKAHDTLSCRRIGLSLPLLDSQQPTTDDEDWGFQDISFILAALRIMILGKLSLPAYRFIHIPPVGLCRLMLEAIYSRMQASLKQLTCASGWGVQRPLTRHHSMPPPPPQCIEYTYDWRYNFEGADIKFYFRDNAAIMPMIIWLYHKMIWRAIIYATWSFLSYWFYKAKATRHTSHARYWRI